MKTRKLQRIAVALALAPMLNLTTVQQPAAQATLPVVFASRSDQQPQTEQDLSQTDLEAIQAAVTGAVGRPGLPEPTIRSIVVEGPWGLASWQMGEAGGTVALWKEEFWEVYQLGGGMPDAEAVNQRSDIPVAVAQRLLDRLFTN